FSTLSAQSFRDSHDKIGSVFAEIQHVISLYGGLEIVVERGVVQFLPRPVDLVQHRILDIVSLLLQALDLERQVYRLFPSRSRCVQYLSEHAELGETYLDEADLLLPVV